MYKGGENGRTRDVFWEKEFYQVIRENGGIWNDSKERPQKYIDREYKNKTKKIHVVKNKVLLAELEYKLGRILELENRKPNYFRQHITDVKNYLIEELNKEKNDKSDESETGTHREK